MKKIFSISLLLLAIVSFTNAATRGDVKVIEASENIRYLSQKIIKDYLFLYKNPNRKETEDRLNKELGQLSSNLRVIATTTKDVDTKDILEFLAYSKDQIEQIVSEKPTEEQAALMLDYSETLLEGADSIALAHKYDFSKEEQMLITMKKIEYLLERITKYYMAMNTGFDSSTNKEQMKKAILDIEVNLMDISLYSYPQEFKGLQNDVDMSWRANKMFFEKSDKLFIPKLMLLSVSYMENFINQLTTYHSKNQ